MATTTATTTTAAPSIVTPALVLRTAESTQKAQEEAYKYLEYMPTFVNDQYAPLTPFEHVDPAARALEHANPRAFLEGASSVTEITPFLGSEVHGLDLTSLDSDGRDQLALEVARRGVLVFRDQQAFIDSGAEYLKDWGRHFGRLHVHPTSGHPANHPEFHLVYKDANTSFNFERSDSITSTVWHSDVSYELQPPGLTTFFLLDQPSTGGDTLFTNQTSTLRKLSPSFVAFLRTLKAVHSGVEQAEFSRSGNRGGVVRREPVENIHPVIRRHPVTGAEAIYVNRQFTRKIVGLKREESETILKFLYDHIDKSIDLQARLKWQPGTVALWDNRVTAHSAIVDYGESGARRHGLRVTPQAERPIPALEGLDLSA